MEPQNTNKTISLIISPEVQQRMDSARILEEDLIPVIELGERTRRRVYDPEKGTYSAYKESGSITIWVVYRLEGTGYRIVNAYSHRLKIKLEGVWNGKKRESENDL